MGDLEKKGGGGGGSGAVGLKGDGEGEGGGVGWDWVERGWGGEGGWTNCYTFISHCDAKMILRHVKNALIVSESRSAINL